MLSFLFFIWQAMLLLSLDIIDWTALADWPWWIHLNYRYKHYHNVDIERKKKKMQLKQISIWFVHV